MDSSKRRGVVVALLLNKEEKKVHKKQKFWVRVTVEEGRRPCIIKLLIGKYVQYELLIHIHHYSIIEATFPQQQNRMDVVNSKAHSLIGCFGQK